MLQREETKQTEIGADLLSREQHQPNETSARDARRAHKPKNSSCLIGLREEVVDTVRDERRKSTD
jgi:hypothetical protein